MNDVIFDKEKISTEDLISAVKEIFNCQEEDFQKLKQSKWYHIFLRAFTLKGHERYIINDIKSLSKLQQMFIQCYDKDITGVHIEVDKIVHDILEQNKVIEKLYNTCILRIEKQKEPAELDQQDMKILTMFLGKYENSDGTIPEEVQKYNRNVFKSLPIQMAYGDFDGTQLSKVSEPEIFYRCFVEQCMVAGTLETQEWSDNVYNSLRHINLGEAAKERIKVAVKKEVGAAGIEYLYEKYIETTFQFADSDFELSEKFKCSESGKRFFSTPTIIVYRKDTSANAKKFMSLFKQYVEKLGFDTYVELKMEKDLYDNKKDRVNGKKQIIYIGKIKVARDVEKNINLKRRLQEHSYGIGYGTFANESVIRIRDLENSELNSFMERIKKDKEKYADIGIPYDVEAVEMNTFIKECFGDIDIHDGADIAAHVVGGVVLSPLLLLLGALEGIEAGIQGVVNLSHTEELRSIQYIYAFHDFLESKREI